MRPLPDRAVVCSVLRDDPAAALAAVRGCRADVLVELRADGLDADGVARVVAGAGRPLIVTARSARDGGAFAGGTEARRALLERALDAGADWIDVEADGPLADLAADRPRRRIVSLHLAEPGASCAPAALARALDRLRAHPAAAHKLVGAARTLADNAALRDLLARARGGAVPLAAFAMGRAGVPGRICALGWGSWATYGALSAERAVAPGQLAVDELLDVHRAATIGPGTRLFGLAGARLAASPSPAMHGAGYAALGIDARYLPLECDALAEALDWAARAGGPEGLGVTIPFKEDAARAAAELDGPAQAGGSANTLVRRADGDGWRGLNTDAPAALDALRARGFDPRGRRVAVLGAGGTGAAVAAALVAAGADVTLHNRTGGRARAVAARIGARAAEGEPQGWHALVHATPLGAGEPPPVALDRAGEGAGRVVVDFVYAPRPTPLVEAARRLGFAAVDGAELLVRQGTRQFEALTGRPAPRAALERACRERLDRSAAP